MSEGIGVANRGVSYSAGASSTLGTRIRAFRKARGWNQGQLAEACGVTQSQVSRWEKGMDRPSPAALGAIADLANDAERTPWLEDAGVAHYVRQTPENIRHIPVLKDAAAAGTPRAIDEKNIDMYLQLPAALVPRGGKLYGVHVVGDSMSPTVEDGYIALVNIAQRLPGDLIGRMVAARDGDGVTIKWLRKDGEMYFLVPQHTSERHPIRVMQDEGNWSIVGEVFMWIGYPPPPKKAKRGK